MACPKACPKDHKYSSSLQCKKTVSESNRVVSSGTIPDYSLTVYSNREYPYKTHARSASCSLDYTLPSPLQDAGNHTSEAEDPLSLRIRHTSDGVCTSRSCGSIIIQNSSKMDDAHDIQNNDQDHLLVTQHDTVQDSDQSMKEIESSHFVHTSVGSKDSVCVNDSFKSDQDSLFALKENTNNLSSTRLIPGIQSEENRNNVAQPTSKTPHESDYGIFSDPSSNCAQGSSIKQKNDPEICAALREASSVVMHPQSVGNQGTTCISDVCPTRDSHCLLHKTRKNRILHPTLAVASFAEKVETCMKQPPTANRPRLLSGKRPYDGKQPMSERKQDSQYVKGKRVLHSTSNVTSILPSLKISSVLFLSEKSHASHISKLSNSVSSWDSPLKKESISGVLQTDEQGSKGSHFDKEHEHVIKSKDTQKRKKDLLFGKSEINVLLPKQEGSLDSVILQTSERAVMKGHQGFLSSEGSGGILQPISRDIECSLSKVKRAHDLPKRKEEKALCFRQELVLVYNPSQIIARTGCLKQGTVMFSPSQKISFAFCNRLEMFNCSQMEPTAFCLRQEMCFLFSPYQRAPMSLCLRQKLVSLVIPSLVVTVVFRQEMVTLFGLSERVAWAFSSLRQEMVSLFSPFQWVVWGLCLRQEIVVLFSLPQTQRVAWAFSSLRQEMVSLFKPSQRAVCLRWKIELLYCRSQSMVITHMCSGAHVQCLDSKVKHFASTQIISKGSQGFFSKTRNFGGAQFTKSIMQAGSKDSDCFKASSSVSDKLTMSEAIEAYKYLVDNGNVQKSVQHDGVVLVVQNQQPVPFFGNQNPQGNVVGNAVQDDQQHPQQNDVAVLAIGNNPPVLNFNIPQPVLNAGGNGVQNGAIQHPVQNDIGVLAVGNYHQLPNLAHGLPVHRAYIVHGG